MSRFQTKVAVVATGVIGAGLLAACGSPSATAPTESSSREAGLIMKDVRLTVVNDHSQPLKITKLSTLPRNTYELKSALESRGVKNNNQQLEQGSEVNFEGDPVVIAISPAGKSVSAETTDSFLAKTESFAKPSITYSRNMGANANVGEIVNPRSSLDVGESVKVTSIRTGRSYVLSRGEDSGDYKIMKIKVL